MKQAIITVHEVQLLFVFCAWIITPLLARSKKLTLWFFIARGMIWLDAIQWQLMESVVAAAKHFWESLPEKRVASKREVGT